MLKTEDQHKYTLQIYRGLHFVLIAIILWLCFKYVCCWLGMRVM